MVTPYSVPLFFKFELESDYLKVSRFLFKSDSKDEIPNGVILNSEYTVDEFKLNPTLFSILSNLNQFGECPRFELSNDAVDELKFNLVLPKVISNLNQFGECTSFNLSNGNSGAFTLQEDNLNDAVVRFLSSFLRGISSLPDMQDFLKFVTDFMDDFNSEWDCTFKLENNTFKNVLSNDDSVLDFESFLEPLDTEYKTVNFTETLYFSDLERSVLSDFYLQKGKLESYSLFHIVSTLNNLRVLNGSEPQENSYLSDFLLRTGGKFEFYANPKSFFGSSYYKDFLYGYLIDVNRDWRLA